MRALPKRALEQDDIQDVIDIFELIYNNNYDFTELKQVVIGYALDNVHTLGEGLPTKLEDSKWLTYLDTNHEALVDYTAEMMHRYRSHVAAKRRSTPKSSPAKKSGRVRKRTRRYCD